MHNIKTIQGEEAVASNSDEVPQDAINWTELENDNQIANESYVQDQDAVDNRLPEMKNKNTEAQSPTKAPMLKPIPTPPVTRSGRQVKWSRT